VDKKKKTNLGKEKTQTYPLTLNQKSNQRRKKAGPSSGTLSHNTVNYIAVCHHKKMKLEQEKRAKERGGDGLSNSQQDPHLKPSNKKQKKRKEP